MAIASSASAPLERAQLKAAGHTLGRAFVDDPAFSWMLPDEAKRAAPLEWFFTCASDYGLRWGEVYRAGEAIDGAAIWLPPGDTSVPAMRMMRVGMWQGPFRLGLGAMRRFLTFVEWSERLHKKNVPEPHWYLMVLGVDPTRQGQGVGSGLITPMLARADEQGRACYLETAKERNVTFYRKHGFDVVDDEHLPTNGPRVWTMLRKPAAR
jgi:ribosomal protein S18 acetylase RimI-like enzyme